MILALTCGWVVACRDDAAGGLPPKAQTVPNAPLVPLPIPGTEDDASTGSTSVDRTSLYVAIDIDQALSADRWTVRTSIEGETMTGGDASVGDWFTEGRQKELYYEPPSKNPSAAVTIEFFGSTKLANGSNFILGHRIMRTHFVPGESRMAYFFVDDQCAYSGCANDQESCYEGKCRTQDIAAETLPSYRADWRKHPPSPCEAATPEVRLGEGLAAYAEREDGDTVTVECGPQGGHHIWVSARARGLDQRYPLVTVSSPASDAGAPLVTSRPLSRLYASEAASYCETLGVQFQLDPDGRPVQGYLGKPLDITLAIQDQNGQTAQVTRHLQVAPKLSTTSCFSP